MRVRLGSRGSALALWQADFVKARLEGLGHDVDITVITTTGDRVLDRPLEAVGGKGAFLKEIEEAMLGGEIDLAVHSLKDVPTTLPEGLELAAILERADARDALIATEARSLGDLPAGSRIGTSSLRRRAQLRALRPDLAIEDLRGNVDTRIRRLREGRFDAILLAMAGLKRLGRDGEVTLALDPGVLLPAPGQGAIAIECPSSAREARQAVESLDHLETRTAVTAERAFLAALGGGCNVPLAAFAEPDPASGLRLRALVARPDGSAVLRGELKGSHPERLGRALADDLIAQGAFELISRPSP